MISAVSKINLAKEKALNGERLDFELMLDLLNISEDTQDFLYLGKAAREISAVLTKNKSYLWSAIGVDFAPCDMNCSFCSMGEKWGIVTDKNSYVMETDEIIERARAYAACGVRWIVIRTTQHYPHDEIISIAKKIRATVPGDYELGINTGELTPERAETLCKVGFDFAYHALRIREGEQSEFSPDLRLETMQTISESKLALSSWVEPVGSEHTNEEIARAYEAILDLGTTVSGVMARVPVPGTPLGEIPQISEKRLAHIIAVAGLSRGGIVEDICVHPFNRLAISFGANVATIESGAIPRDGNFSKSNWNDQTFENIINTFEKEGYNTL